MRKFKIILMLLYSVILISCNQNTDLVTLKKGKAIIAGKVENWQQGSSVIRITGDGAVNNIEQTAIIDSLGNFRAELETFHPQKISLLYEKGYTGIYLQANDSIYLKMDANAYKEEGYPKYEISGLSELNIITTKNIRDYNRFVGEIKFNPNAKNKSVEEYLKLLRDEIRSEDSILQDFCEIYNPSSEFKRWAKSEIRYGVANYIISYHAANGLNYDGVLFDNNLFPVDDDLAIVSGLYIDHLRHYAFNNGIWQDSISLKLIRNKEYLAAIKRGLDKIRKEEKPSLSRDIMCYKMLIELYNNSFEDFSSIYKDVDKYLINQLFKDDLQEKKTVFETQEDINITFLDPKTKEEKNILGDFWAELSAKYRGKVVYVDIWATWCSPCKGEIPHALNLQEFYEGKDIVFVNLCLASNKSEWKKMIVNSNIHGDNYFFNKPQTQLLRDKLKFDGYPTYLIIDKEGNLINKNAPRPSSGIEIKGILNELIDK